MKKRQLDTEQPGRGAGLIFVAAVADKGEGTHLNAGLGSPHWEKTPGSAHKNAGIFPSAACTGLAPDPW